MTTVEQQQRESNERKLQIQIERLTEQNAQLRIILSQAGYAPSLSPQSSSASFSPVNNNGQASAPHMLSRSKSTVGHHSSMMGSRPTNQIHSERMTLKQRGRAQSHHPMSATSMSRTTSSRSGSGMPFKAKGAHIEPLPNNPRRTSAPQADLLHYGRSLADVQENDVLPGVGVSPNVFLASQPDDSSYLATTRTNMSADAIALYNYQAAPSMCSSTSVPDMPGPLTRENSLNWTQTSAMIKDPSAQSRLGDAFLPHDMHSLGSTEGFTKPNPMHPATDQALLGLGASLQDHMQMSPTFNDISMYLPPSDTICMERTDSNSTDASTSSVKSNASAASIRSQQRMKEVIKNSQMTKIVPKQPKVAISPQPILKKSQVATSKSSYQRPPHTRVYCKKCNDHPMGFRGEHEYQRHASAKHSPVTTKWVCLDPSTQNMHSPLQPKVPLAGCKSCDAGKQYNAYYNAAAHLRRWHFNPKLARTKSKAPKGEKRGGKAGGSWPPMPELKMWFQKITVRADDPVALEQFTVEEECEDEDEYEDMMDEDVIDTSTMDTSSMSFAASDSFSLGSVGDGALISSTQVSPSLVTFEPSMLPAASNLAMMTGDLFEGEYCGQVDSDLSNDAWSMM